jgi:hypothetical protein
MGNVHHHPAHLEVHYSCLICGKAPLDDGAYWHGAVEHDVAHVAVCTTCVNEGKLGALLGDALAEGGRFRVERVEDALDRTAREAWRALVLHDERRRNGR